MKIIEIRGFNLSFPLAEPMGNALNVFRKRDALLIQIRTDSGLSGWGEAGNSPHGAGTFIRVRLAGLILGKSPAEYGRHLQSMCASVGYDRRGTSMMAISAIDIALHDLAAQMHGISVAALMGGAVRNEVFAYASGPFVRMPDPYREYQREVDQYLSLNFKAIKPRGGVEPRADGIMANALRKQVGPDIGIMVDINQGYTAAAAIRAARFMEDADLIWIEEQCNRRTSRAINPLRALPGSPRPAEKHSQACVPFVIFWPQVPSISFSPTFRYAEATAASGKFGRSPRRMICPSCLMCSARP
jgi:L-alanine-DL-glutamate epimerase-like enolase superfamily enzyme